MTVQDIIARARAMYATTYSDNVQIDDDASLSQADDGAWVQAWVWVPYEGGDDA